MLPSDVNHTLTWRLISALRPSRNGHYCAAPMGLSLGKSITLFVCAALFLFCSCDRHQPGELPEVQRDKVEEAKAPVAEKAETTATSPSPTVKPTAAEFFPTKP